MLQSHTQSKESEIENYIICEIILTYNKKRLQTVILKKHSLISNFVGS